MRKGAGKANLAELRLDGANWSGIVFQVPRGPHAFGVLEFLQIAPYRLFKTPRFTETPFCALVALRDSREPLIVVAATI